MQPFVTFRNFLCPQKRGTLNTLYSCFCLKTYSPRLVSFGTEEKISITEACCNILSHDQAVLANVAVTSTCYLALGMLYRKSKCKTIVQKDIQSICSTCSDKGWRACIQIFYRIQTDRVWLNEQSSTQQNTLTYA